MSFNILAVGRCGMGEEAVAEHAAARAAEEHAALTLMGIWSPTPLIQWARLAGVDPSELIQDHGEQSSRWIREVVAGLPEDVSVKFACRRGLPRRHIAAELRAGHYDELIVSRTLLSQRRLAKLARQYAELRIELVDTQLEHHGGVRVRDEAVLAVPLDGARKHGALDVRAEPH